ncbi:hypothetical protein HZA97_07415 [Candidatus Woesearchaeota archaeon]|nr:hypothetical protein [Candidatus Woesearchaeota archaeon]
MKNSNSKIWSVLLLICSLLFLFGGVVIYYFAVISTILTLGTQKDLFNIGVWISVGVVVLSLFGILYSVYLFVRK